MEVVENGEAEKKIDDEDPQSASERTSGLVRSPAAAVLSSLKSGFTTAALSPSASI